MRIKIYQSNGDRNNNQFMNYDFTMAHGGIDESLYKMSFMVMLTVTIWKIYMPFLIWIEFRHIRDIVCLYRM